MRKRKSLDETYLRMAEVLADCRVYATRAQVGALLVKEKSIIAEGYNGMPAGMPNGDIEKKVNGEIITSPYAIHAEANAFDKLSKHGKGSARGATLYCTYSPCVPCCLRIINNKVKRVVFRHYYRDRSGLPMLRSRGIRVVKLLGEDRVQRSTPPSRTRKNSAARPGRR